MTSSAAALAQVAHGPALAGIFMNIMLYGIMISQTFFYYAACKDDPTWVKLYVVTLFVADTLNSVFNMWWIYNVLINNFGNVAALQNADWLFESEEALAGVIAMLVQLFYAWRIRRLTKNNWIVSAIVVTSLVGGLSGIGTAIGVAMRPDFAKLQQLKVIVCLWLVGAGVCDIIITASLTLHLRQRRTGYTRTDSVISRVINLTMSNGLLTAGFAIADVVAYLSSPTGLHIGFNYALAKLYGNSMMASLNSRPMVSYSRSKGSSYARELSVMGARNADVSGSKASQPAQLVVNVETHELVDNGSGVGTTVTKGDPEWNSTEYSQRQSDSKDAIVM